MVEKQPLLLPKNDGNHSVGNSVKSPTTKKRSASDDFRNPGPTVEIFDDNDDLDDVMDQGDPADVHVEVSKKNIFYLIWHLSQFFSWMG